MNKGKGGEKEVIANWKKQTNKQTKQQKHKRQKKQQQQLLAKQTLTKAHLPNHTFTKTI